VISVRWRACDWCIGCIPISCQKQGFRQLWTFVYFTAVIVEKHLVLQEEITGFDLANRCYEGAPGADNHHCVHFRSAVLGEAQHPFLEALPPSVLKDWGADRHITWEDAQCYGANAKTSLWSSEDFGCDQVNGFSAEEKAVFMEAPFASNPEERAVCSYLCTRMKPPKLYSILEGLAVAWVINTGLFTIMLAVGRPLAMRAQSTLDLDFESPTACGDNRDDPCVLFLRFLWLLTPLAVLYVAVFVFFDQPILDKILVLYFVCVSTSTVILRCTRVIPEILWTTGECAFMDASLPGDSETQALSGSAFVASDRVTLLEWLTLETQYQKKMLQFEALPVNVAVERTASRTPVYQKLCLQARSQRYSRFAQDEDIPLWCAQQ